MSEQTNGQAGGAVVVVATPAAPVNSSESPQSSTEQTEQAIAYGQMIETTRQAIARQEQLESELRELRQGREVDAGTINRLCSELESLQAAIREAAAEEEEENGETAEVIPDTEPELPKEPELPPVKPKSFWEKLADTINGA